MQPRIFFTPYPALSATKINSPPLMDAPPPTGVLPPLEGFPPSPLGGGGV